MKNELDTLLLNNGYQEISTGGNCLAYSKSLGDGWYLLITDYTGVDIPKSLKEKIIIGIYHDEYNSSGFSKDGSPFYPKQYNSIDEINETVFINLRSLKQKLVK